MKSTIVLAFLLALQASCGQPQIKPTAATTPATTPSTASALPALPSPTPQSSFWLRLLERETTWTLYDAIADEDETPAHVLVELTKRRVVDGVVIAELDWTLVSGTDRESLSSDVPGVIAADGVRVFVISGFEARDGVTDAELIKSLRETPTFREDKTDNETFDDGYSEYRQTRETTLGTMICFGEGPPDDDDFECPDTCFAEVCFSDRDGPVRLDGTWAPQDGIFVAEGYKDVH